MNNGSLNILNELNFENVLWKVELQILQWLHLNYLFAPSSIKKQTNKQSLSPHPQIINFTSALNVALGNGTSVVSTTGPQQCPRTALPVPSCSELLPCNCAEHSPACPSCLACTSTCYIEWELIIILESPSKIMLHLELWWSFSSGQGRHRMLIPSSSLTQSWQY